MFGSLNFANIWGAKLYLPDSVKTPLCTQFVQVLLQKPQKNEFGHENVTCGTKT